MPKNTQVMLMKDLTIELGSNKVLNEVNLAMRTGERLAIVGPSGAGKSTILRLLAGLLLPSKGSLQISGFEQNYLRLDQNDPCLLYTSPSPRDGLLSRMPSSA